MFGKIIEKTIGKIKKMGNFYQLCVSANMGILTIGIFLVFIGWNNPLFGGGLNDVRITMGEVFIMLWFITFPSLESEKKEKIMCMVLIQLVVFVIASVMLLFGIQYLTNNLKSGSIVGDLLFSVGGIAIFAYIWYNLLTFFKTFLKLIRKVKNVLFPKFEKASIIINVIESITAGILSITGLGTSIVGLLEIIKKIIESIS